MKIRIALPNFNIKRRRTRNGFLIVFSLLVFLPCAMAETPIFQIEIRNHLFQPSTLVIPAGVKIKLIISNRDSSPEEFESYELNREKVIMGNTQSVVFIGPLEPGEYPFFGEFNPKTAQGIIIAEEK